MAYNTPELVLVGAAQELVQGPVPSFLAPDPPADCIDPELEYDDSDKW